MGGAVVFPWDYSVGSGYSCISIKPVGPGLDRMVSLKGGLRRVVIQQLRLLGIVRAQVIKASSSTNNRLSVWSRTLVRKPFPPSTDARAMLSTRP